MDPRSQLEEILPAVIKLVEAIEPDQLAAPTPCSNFNVLDVVNHMISLGGTFAYAFRGEEPPEPGPAYDGDQVPASAFRQAMEGLLDSVNSAGAMQRTIETPMGPMTGETFARLVAFDGLVHGWDIARGASIGYELPAETVEAVYAFAQVAISEEMRDGDTFKDAVTSPPGASPIEQVAAFSGRTI